MRARLHVRDGHAGFFLEGTHTLCDGRATAQLLDGSWTAIDAVAAELRHAGLSGEADLELSENVAGDERAIHVEFDPSASVRARDLRLTSPDVSGLSWSVRGAPRESIVAGSPLVVDVLPRPGDDAAPGVRLQRHVRAFFQGNRFLLGSLVDRVASSCLDGPVVDLYAGVGLFGVSLAARGASRVHAVEGHHASARDLRANASPYADTLTVVEAPVEHYLASAPPLAGGTLVLDPPRTGMTRAAMTGATRLGADRVVFVSCDVATFARDVRAFVEAGYALDHVEAFDLFPNTAHVEVMARLTRA
jgi:23S rRNA (uracil1939-C5)-methyltransferase